MALAASTMFGIGAGEKREERFSRRVTAAEKHQLEIFFGYIRLALPITASSLPD